MGLDLGRFQLPFGKLMSEIWSGQNHRLMQRCLVLIMTAPTISPIMFCTLTMRSMVPLFQSKGNYKREMQFISFTMLMESARRSLAMKATMIVRSLVSPRVTSTQTATVKVGLQGHHFFARVTIV